jgi:hypothetical protein
MKHLSIFILIALNLISCKKTVIHTKKRLKGDREVLVGTYEWDSTYSMCTYVDCCTSYQEDFTLYLVDSTYSVEFLKKGEVIYIKNNSKREQYKIINFCYEARTDTSFNYMMDLKSTTNHTIKSIQITKTNDLVIISGYPMKLDEYAPSPKIVKNYFHKKE